MVLRSTSSSSTRKLLLWAKVWWPHRLLIASLSSITSTIPSIIVISQWTTAVHPKFSLRKVPYSLHSNIQVGQKLQATRLEWSLYPDERGLAHPANRSPNRKVTIEQNDNLEVEVKRMPKCATLKQTAFYTEDSLQYKYKGIFLSLFCGLLNLGGEFCVVLCF